MSWSRLFFPSFLITILIFAGVARGQGRYELQEQGQQPLGNNTAKQEKWLQPLQSDLLNQEQQGFNNPKTIGPQPKSKPQNTPINIKASKVKGIKSMLNGNISKTNSFAFSSKVADIKNNAKGNIAKTNSFAFSSNHYGMEEGKGPQIGVSHSDLLGMEGNQSSSSRPTSFLDGYLLNSLHNGGWAGKKMRGEDKPKDDIPLKSGNASKFY